jgi:hypothetical protein
VRASLGLGTTAGDVDRLLAAIGSVALHGPAARYLHIGALDEYEPVRP